MEARKGSVQAKTDQGKGQGRTALCSRLENLNSKKSSRHRGTTSAQRKRHNERDGAWVQVGQGLTIS